MQINFVRLTYVPALIILAILSKGSMVEAAAKQCSSKKRAEILSPASASNKIVKVACSIKLSKRDVITKRVFIEGAKASGAVFNCNGATLDARPGTVNAGFDVLVIRSKRSKKGRWSRPKNVTIKNCKIYGSFRIYGMGRHGEAKVVKASSVFLGHTKRAQNAAPTKLRLNNLLLVGQNRIPLYLAPGVTSVTFENSVIKGRSHSVAIYLDAESAHNRIINNRFNVRTPKRELIAIDGSAYNLVSRNTFSQLGNGGIYLYRNCGEGGTVRHQKPQYNKIVENGFFYRKFKGYKKSLRGFGKKKYIPAVWIGSRNGNRKYCSYDNGYNFGSSKNNGDFALNNTVANNQIVKLSPAKMIRSFSAGNEIFGNRTVKKIRLGKKKSAPNVRPIAPQPKKPTPRKPKAQRGEFSFNCKVKGNNNGCKKFVQCPAGLRVEAVKAACDLEAGRVKKTQLDQVRWNSLRVVRRSDRVRHGVCSIGEVDIAQGGANLSLLRGFERFYIGCREYDKNGGDCEIRGQVVCR